MVATNPAAPNPSTPPFFPGSPVYFPIEIVDDFSELLVDPASITVTVRDPTGTLYVLTSAVKFSVGVWEQAWIIPAPAAPGIWYFSLLTTAGAQGGGGLVYGAFSVGAPPF